MGYRDSVEEFLRVMTGSTFVKNAAFDSATSTLFVNFYGSYEEYKNDNNNVVEKPLYDNYFSTGAKIEKLFVLESARLLRDFKEIEVVSMVIVFNGKEYNANVKREELNEHIGYDITELSPLNDTWRERFSDVYGYGLKNEKRKLLFEKFTTIK